MPFALRSHERRSVPFPAFLADEISALMVGKGRDALVFTSPGGGVLRVSHFRPRVLTAAVTRLRRRSPSSRGSPRTICGKRRSASP